MYIPLAIHKNELVLIDSMDTFSHYFCLAKKQKMTPLASGSRIHVADEAEDSSGRTPFFEDGAEAADEDDDL